MERTSAPAATARAVVANHAAPLVSIVMVTYGTGDVVLDALAAVAEHTTVPYEVIVVDNPVDDSAPDGRTADVLRARTVGVTLVTPPANLGFGGANDEGVRIARGDLVCFLNPDAIVGPDWLEPLVAALDDPVVAIAAPPLLDPDGALQEAGQVIYADGCTAAVGGPEVLSGDVAQLFDRDVDYASAACWLVRRDEHVARGGFDARFHPAFFEDADYGVRVERDGQVTRLVTASPVVHHRGGGGAGRDLALGERGLAVFRSLHADELAARPPRPTDLAGELALRDRLATVRTLRIVGASARAGAVRRELDAAIAAANASPRERIAVLVHAPVPVDDRELARARRAGVEVVVADSPAAAEEIATSRRSAGWEVHPPSSGGRRRLLADPPSAPMLAAVAAVALAGIAARWIVLRSSAGRLNADEAYTGIEAFEVLAGRFPVVLGGTAYTAVFEAYLYAPYAWLFGGDVLALKLIATVFWLIASLAIAAIAHDVVARDPSDAGSRRAGRRAALLAGGLAWVAPGALLTLSTNAYASYASGMAVTAVAFWLARRLVDEPAPSWRLAAALGVGAGLGFWMHPMYLSTLVPMLLVVVAVHPRRGGVWAGVIGGGLAGCSPLLVWNAVSSWPSLESPAPVDGTYAERLTTFVRDLLPRAYGLRDGALEWMVPRMLGLGLYALLLATAIVGAVLAVRGDRRPSRFLLPVVLAAVLPIMAAFAPLIYANDGRYGIISFPFVVVALAVAGEGLARRVASAVGDASRPAVTAAAFAVVAGLWVGAFLGPQLRLLLDETDGDPNASIVEVADRIRAGGFEHVYGSYWRVLPVDFVSGDAVIGGVLAPFPVRFPERQQAVEAADPADVAFVFQLDDDDPARLWLPTDAYDRSVIGDTVLYLPRP